MRGSDLEPGYDGSYYLPRARALSGLDIGLGFKFDEVTGALCEISPVSRTRRFKVRHSSNKMCVIPLEVLYEELQAHLEATFGPPTTTSLGTEGFLDHMWLFPGVQIKHYVGEHFGPSEHVFIEKVDQGEGTTVPPGSSVPDLIRIPKGMNSREAQNLRAALRFMEREGRVEVLDLRGASSLSRGRETWCKFAGTETVCRFVELDGERGGRWELVMPGEVRGVVQ